MEDSHSIITPPLLQRWYRANYNWVMRSYYNTRHRLNLPTLRMAQWVTTFRCNYKCKGCEAGAGRVGDDELNTTEAMNLIKDFADLGVHTMLAGGGEPLMRDDLFEVLRYARKLGLKLAIGTNGYFVRRFEKELGECNLSWAFTSIDGLEESCDSYRGMPGAFQHALDTLSCFREIGVPRRIVVTVVHPGNLHQLSELSAIIEKSAATEWRVSPCRAVGRAENEDSLWLNRDQIRQVMQFVAQARSHMRVEMTEQSGYLGHFDAALRYRPFFCSAGLKSCVVLPEGSVVGCAPPYDKRFAEANIRDKPLKEIWMNGFGGFRNPKLSSKCKSCDHLKSCHGGCWPVRDCHGECSKYVWESWDGRNA